MFARKYSLDDERISFTISDPEFDHTKYTGRFREFQKTCNPLLAFYSNTRIKEMQAKLKEQEELEER